MSNEELLLILRQMGITYSSITVVSLIFNKIYYNNKINKVFENSKRKLKFKELSSPSEAELNKIKDFCQIENIVSFLASITPVVQLIWTVNNITRNPKVYEEFLNEKMEDVNLKELKMRKRFLEELKKREVPEDVRIKMLDDDYLPTEEDYLKSKKLKREKKMPVLRDHPIDDEHGRFWE